MPLTQDQALYNLLVGLVVPMVVALLAHVHAASWVKSSIMLVLSALGSVLTTTTTSDFHWRPFLLSFALAVIMSGIAHMTFLKQFQITGAQGAIQRLWPKGVGNGTTDAPAASGNAAPNG